MDTDGMISSLSHSFHNPIPHGETVIKIIVDLNLTPYHHDDLVPSTVNIEIILLGDGIHLKNSSG